MQPETKKLGSLLVDAGLITPTQLQDSLRYQRISGERLGSALVSQGLISEEVLMDFLARQTGVPRLDVKALEIPAAVLQRIPRRLAEQMNILPVSFKEPKSLVLAMADPMDLNAVDSARFASGLNIEPVVASHTALRQAIGEHYNRATAAAVAAPAVDPAPLAASGKPLPVHLDFSPQPAPAAPVPSPAAPGKDLPRDPFFNPPEDVSPFSFFSDSVGSQGSLPAPAAPTQPPIIHQRSAMSEYVPQAESYGTRALVLGLVRLLQRRGILGQDELQRFLNNLAESGELDPTK
jgi:hypothetical protein